MDERLKQIQKLLDAAEGNLHSARNMMREMISSDNASLIDHEEKARDLNVIEEGRIVEGVYNGENMVGPDGKEYPVPANYASKSKLVEGDVLKLTIADDGSFIFKQIKPIDRRKTVGTLSYAGGNYSVNAEGKTYKVLQASVTYYRGEPGDQVTMILPKDHDSTWGAIENIIKASEATGDNQQSTESEVIEAPASEATTAEAAADVPAKGNGPEIEFPAKGSSDLDAEDKQILQSLSEKTVPVEPVPKEPTAPAEPAQVPEEPEVDNSKGISELDI